MACAQCALLTAKVGGCLTLACPHRVHSLESYAPILPVPTSINTVDHLLCQVIRGFDQVVTDLETHALPLPIPTSVCTLDPLLLTQVIRGFDQAVTGLELNGTRKARIQPEDAYGGSCGSYSFTLLGRGIDKVHALVVLWGMVMCALPSCLKGASLGEVFQWLQIWPWFRQLTKYRFDGGSLVQSLALCGHSGNTLLLILLIFC